MRQDEIDRSRSCGAGTRYPPGDQTRLIFFGSAQVVSPAITLERSRRVGHNKYLPSFPGGRNVWAGAISVNIRTDWRHTDIGGMSHRPTPLAPRIIGLVSVGRRGLLHKPEVFLPLAAMAHTLASHIRDGDPRGHRNLTVYLEFVYQKAPASAVRPFFLRTERLGLGWRGVPINMSK